ncbi:hypothetical protein JCM24511_02649 [Saitozyma sp. JCM 24511]|nr:hypothetical protein JCM24511_02649 [Saitozyma sp. JCM 24511]
MQGRRSASPPSRGQGGKKRLHRACVPVEGDERCKRCLDHDMPCDKLSAPPKDARPRRRFLFKGASGGLSQYQGVEAGYLGSSSLVHLAWKYAPQRADVIDKFRGIDDRHDLYRGSVGGLEQDGLLVGQTDAESSKSARPMLVSVSMAKARLVQELGSETVLNALYETCRDRIIPLFPVISVSESLLADKATDEHVNKYAAIDPHSTPPTPLPHIVRMIHCAIASRSRTVPTHIQQSILSSLHSLLSGPEMAKIVTSRSLGNIQVLLLLAMCDDLNGADAVAANETVWQNVGTAIRMAFGIGLHRNVSPSHIPYFQLNRRLRVWGACVCMDRCYADGIREGERVVPGRDEPAFPCFRFLAEFTSLSMLLGRAYRLIGTPHGLQSADELSFIKLQMDIDSWTSQLPTLWQYSIRLVLDQAPALMNLFIVTLEFTLQRCFLWPTSPIPPHITYRPTRERWMALVQRVEDAVHWLNTPDGAFYLDVWSNTVYPAFCCVIICLKLVEESGDPHHRTLLNLADTAIQQWAMQSPSDPVRNRLAAMSALLRSIGTESMTTTTTLPVQDMAFDNIVTHDPGFDAVAFDQMVQGLFSDGSTTSSLATGFDPMAFEQTGMEALGLDPLWFEHV